MAQDDTMATRWVFGVAVLLLAAVLIVGQPATAHAQAADPVAQAVYETVPIEIRPGAVRIDWTVERIDPTAGCAAAAWIRPEGVARPIATVYAVRLTGAGDGIEAGQLPLDGIGPGRYLLDLSSSDCWWTINVVAQ